MTELGGLFRAARLQRGLSLQEASARTRIREQYLDSIEEGNFRAFPGRAYATGFLRNYAVFLGLNADEIVETYHSMHPSAAIRIEPATSVGVQRLRRRMRRKVAYALIGALVLGGLGEAAHRYSDSLASAAAPIPYPATPAGAHNSHPGHSLRPSAPSNAPVGPSSLRVHALATVWLLVRIPGKAPWWGPVSAGSTRSWTGQTVSVQAHDGPAVLTWANGKHLGPLSRHSGRVRLTVYPDFWQRLQ